ncbi:hypothetical protein PU706_003770 [Cronobacter sakazakii]|nr:hypothetical protein [Cronobacter sakazakii]EKK5187049.1 hypothetical protein [Cronobacter sakazakii]EKK5191353.1 hypothetical protein [Cronobacter sakazakii]EKK5241373.1 hypothetical protein [Cronobacter sakazakii]EKK5263434.1 hypothetical protein [Cronobacter sakazakii]
MNTISNEQAKDLRNAFECWQQDYDPVEDKEQYDMFGLGIVAMDELLALRKEREKAEPVAWTEKCEITNMQATGLYLRGFPDGSQGRDIPLYTAPPAPVVPDGWKLVPEIPDSQMLTAWKDANYNNASLESAFRKMVNAAPKPPHGMQALDKSQLRELFEKWCPVNIERNKWHPETYSHLPARQLWGAWSACSAAMLNQSQPVAETDTTAQKFESLAGKAVSGSEGFECTPVADLYELLTKCGECYDYTTSAKVAADWINYGYSAREYVKLDRLQEALVFAAPEPCK